MNLAPSLPSRLRSLAFAASALGLLALIPPCSAANARSRPGRGATADTGTYRGAIVMDAATGNVLWENNAAEVAPPASMTKLMTYAVLHDRLAGGGLTLATPVPIDPSDAGIGGTQVYLDPRETFSVEELIYAMMIQSANDAAHALARASAGSVQAFVELMNAKAGELGMTHTTFRTPHGLPPSSRRLDDGDVTTPRDFGLLCRYLLLRTDVLKYTAVRERDFAPARKQGPIAMTNHNKLLGKVAGVDGLKTGYTERAGYCLSATAERNGRRVIVIIMGALGPGGQRDLGKSRDIRAVELLERGFAALPQSNPPFASERAKYTKPAVIPLDSPVGPAAPATPGTALPATAGPGPTIRLPLLRK